MKKYLIIISFLVITVSVLFLLFRFKNNNYQFNSISILALNEVSTEKKIVEIASDYSYKININYPYTGYSNLNNEIDNLIKKYLNDFMKADKPFIDNQIYSLDITYDTYQYKEFISYVFTVFLNTGGAHPNTIIETISYDTKNENIIDIDWLINKNNDILNILSKESRVILDKNPSLKQGNITDMTLDGIMPRKDNFSNFAFTDKGLMLFFNRYQIAPYSYGSFNIIIPYSSLVIL